MSKLRTTLKTLGLAIGLFSLLLGGIISPAAYAAAPQSSSNVAPTVVGGGSSTIPWAVSIQTLGILGINHECGGTLIAPQWVMTAAHCTDYINTILSVARVGSLYKSHGGELLKVTKVIAHPDFLKADGSFGNDIALLKLSRPATAATYPLAPTGDIGSTGVAAGWGTTCDDDVNNPLCSLALPDKLKEVNLSRVVDTDCTLIDPTSGVNINDPDTMDCFVATSGLQEGICFGDSGSPFMQQKNGVWSVVGVINADMDSTTAHPDVCSAAPNGGTNHQATTDVWPFKAWLEQTIATN